MLLEYLFIIRRVGGNADSLLTVAVAVRATAHGVRYRFNLLPSICYSWYVEI